jgi:eukaryotic-like serine/threonine-protein kinase
MNEPPTCPNCGTSLADAALGLCPRCLVALGLALDSEAEPATPVTDPAVDQATTLKQQPTTHFGDYELLELLAQGGMGVVYKARQVSLNRLVALKMIRAGVLASPAEVKRFRSEAEAVAQLRHPNIVGIYEIGESAGQHYFSMEFVAGRSLAEVVRDGPLSARRAATYVKAIAEAVHYAHQHGIVHRDLKPANVMIDESDQPRITDFGLAKRLDDSALRTPDSTLTLSGQVLGSPNYLPPEQAEPHRGQIGPRSDVYALGAILYHLVTGRPPFQAESLPTLLGQVLETEPVAPRILNPSLPRDFETICLKCLEKEQERRYPTAQALADELGHFLCAEPIAARPVGRPEKVWRWCRRQPVRAGLVAALLVTFVLGSGGVLWQWRKARQEQQIALANELQAHLARQQAETNLWQAYLAQARGNRWSGRPGRRFESLAALSNAAAIRPSLELRNEAIACLALPDMQVRNRLRFARPTVVFGLAFDPEYERFALVEQDGSITVRQLRDDTELCRFRIEGRPDSATPLFSANGQFLAERYHGAPADECRVWNLSRRELVLRRALNVRTLCFVPGDEQIVVAEVGGAIHFYALRNGEEMRRLTVPGLNQLCFAPDGKRLAVSRTTAPGVVVVDLETESICRSFTNSAAVGFMSWSPDGRVLACPGPDGRVRLWDPDTGEIKGVLEGHRGDALAAAFDHAGDLLISSGWDGMTRLWDPRLRRPVVSLPGGWVTPGFAHDDRLLAIATDETGAMLCDVASPGECLELGDAGFHPGWEGAGQFSADGRLLATAGEDGVRIWDVGARLQVCFLPLHASRSVLFLPDGRALLTAGDAGLKLWPILSRPPGAPFKLASAESLAPETRSSASLTCDGRGILVTDPDGMHVALRGLGAASGVKRLGSHPGLVLTAPSPDGKWFATGTWHGNGVRVFELPSGELREELPVKFSAACAFSPDSQTLVTGNGDGYCLWRVGSWQQPVWTVAREGAGDMIGSMTFAPDGRVLALLHGRSTRTKLVATADGHELATFDAGRPLCFSPDGSRLATIAEDLHSVLLWDLPLIRRHLASVKLDWDLPPAP